MLESFSLPDSFFISLIKIIGIDIVLSGDNAVLIALAARKLPPDQQKKVVFFGAWAAVIMRILVTFVAVALLTMPYLKLVGAVFLVWIGIKLICPDEEKEEVKAGDNLWAAIKTIIIADLVMSIDNVIAIAAASKGSFLLLMIGLAISIPLVIFGATLMLKWMTRYPIIITIGGGLLGYVGGEMAVTDPAIATWVAEHVNAMKLIFPIACAVAVVFIGGVLERRKKALESMEK